MNKKLQKALKDANKELKDRKYLVKFQIVIDGDFTSEYNEVRLQHDCHCFPICNAETEGEAIAAIAAYIAGLSHGEEKSYVKFCDKNY